MNTISSISVKKTIKQILPSSLLSRLRELRQKSILKKENALIFEVVVNHQNSIKKVKEKRKPINVVFFALMDSVWKYDYLYHIMEHDGRFKPIVLVCPVVNYGRDNMLRHLYKCYNTFRNKGYNVILSYDEGNNAYLNVKEKLRPDIIFYTNPHEGLIDNRYYITKYADVLTCYTNYFFHESNHYEISCDTLFQNLLWKKYVETDFHKKLYYKNQRIKGKNVVHTGYPGIDCFIDKTYNPRDDWKIKDKKIKRIIWAPHHTIQNYVYIQYSTFLKFTDFILEIADKYKDKIQIAFKPHPILISKLYIEWGKEKTDAYYEKWKNLENGMLCDGPYQDLFLTSDAIMHDSGSFILEYLFTGKPALHLDNGIAYESQYNELAIEALSHYYHATTEAEIENFIKLLIDNKDPKSIERKRFVEEKLLPPNGKLASQNIFDDLVKSLGLDQTNG